MTQHDVYCFLICFGEPAKSCFENTPAEPQKKHIPFDMDCRTFFKGPLKEYSF